MNHPACLFTEQWYHGHLVYNYGLWPCDQSTERKRSAALELIYTNITQRNSDVRCHTSDQIYLLIEYTQADCSCPIQFLPSGGIWIRWSGVFHNKIYYWALIHTFLQPAESRSAIFLILIRFHRKSGNQLMFTFCLPSKGTHWRNFFLYLCFFWRSYYIYPYWWWI